MVILVCVPDRSPEPDPFVMETVDAAIMEFGELKARPYREVTPYGVTVARNKAVHRMLTHEDPKFTHILFVDSDVLIQKDAIKLLAAMDADIATGCYPCIETRYGLQVPYVTVAREVFGDSCRWHRKWFDGIVETEMCGLGCCLIRREVFEKLEYPYFKWMSDVEPEAVGSDDTYFCRNAIKAGFKIYAHGDVRCGHKKKIDISTMLVEPDEVPHDVKWRGPQSIAEKSEVSDISSYLPVLHTVSQHLKIRSAIVYGGSYPALEMLLDREKYRHLENVICVCEEDKMINLLQDRIQDDRIAYQYSHLESMAGSAGLLGDADLVFIDCGEQSHEDVMSRARTELLNYYGQSESQIVVIHDIEQPMLDKACCKAEFTTSVPFRPNGGPHTGVFSNKFNVYQLSLEEGSREYAEEVNG